MIVLHTGLVTMSFASIQAAEQALDRLEWAGAMDAESLAAARRALLKARVKDILASRDSRRDGTM